MVKGGKNKEMSNELSEVREEAWGVEQG